MGCFNVIKANKKKESDVLLLCHANNHKYDKVILNLSKDAKSFATMCIDMKPDYMVDISVPMKSVENLDNRFDLIVDIFCPNAVLAKEETLKNVARMLKPDGLFAFRIGAGDGIGVLGLNDEDKERLDIPCSYNMPDIRGFLKRKAVQDLFKVEHVYIRDFGKVVVGDDGDSDVFDGYLCCDKCETVGSKVIEANIIKECKKYDVDIQNWNAYLDYALVILRKKSVPNGGGKAKYVHVVMGGKKMMRKVYTSKDIGKYIILDKAKVSLVELRGKYRYVEA